MRFTYICIYWGYLYFVILHVYTDATLAEMRRLVRLVILRWLDRETVALFYETKAINTKFKYWFTLVKGAYLRWGIISLNLCE